jgi:ATP-dependent Clp protease adaptor protein ClpS
MSITTPGSDVQVTPRQQTREQTRTRRLPPFNVILENDDYHSIEFVVTVLRKALGFAEERAYQLTMQAHTGGKAVVWTGPKEVAELKAEQISSFHEYRGYDGAKLGPLRCYIEPAPGGES